tara:strand:+ start:179 stop:1054 length:876 start_codon:yes stop_codon:yes gene_type:complete
MKNNNPFYNNSILIIIKDSLMAAEDLKIGIPGAAGRMGRILIETIVSAQQVNLIAVTEVSDHKSIGTDAGSLIGLDNLGIEVTTDADRMFELSDVVIDFTLPDVTEKHLELAVKHNTILIVGTTGFEKTTEYLFQTASKHIAIVKAPNMSLSVNLLLGLTEQVANILDDDYDIEILEMHHRHKVDSPSGTALALGGAAAKGRKISLKDTKITDRDGLIGPRTRGTIGFSAIRGGDVVGDHTVIFAAEGERIELTHKSSSRQTYARGAVAAAVWASRREPGLYSMKDVLGLD